MQITLYNLKFLVPSASHIYAIYPYGSRVYGTADYNSDHDFIMVADGVKDHQQIDTRTRTISIHTYTLDTWRDMLAQHKIFALESYFLPEDQVLYSDRTKFFLNINKSLLRKEISSTVSNSWVKAKKKLSDDKDYIAVKSLFHSFRIAMFGLQIAKTGAIYDYSEANSIWEEIYKDYSEGRLVWDDRPVTHGWEYFNDKYKKRHNELMTEFREYAPK